MYNIPSENTRDSALSIHQKVLVFITLFCQDDALISESYYQKRFCFSIYFIFKWIRIERIRIRRSIWRSVFGLIPFLLFPHPLVLLLFIAWMLWSILASLRKYQGTSFVVKPTELLFRTGWRVQVKRRVEWRKLQRVSIRSNWFMQRKGLADVVLSTAAGPITLPYVRVESAKQLRDWGLFQIESSSAPWM